MTKKIKKLAVIRSNTQDACPFGLPIPFGCKRVGDLITRMAPVDILEDSTEEEKEEIAKANRRLFMWMQSEEPCECRYAGKLFKDKGVVECNWDTDVSGEHEKAALVGSPYYYKHFSGIGLDGLYSYPLGYYTDNSIDRGMYYGMYSIESTGQKEVE